MSFSLQAQDELVGNQKREAVRGEEGDPYNEENGEQVRRISSLMFVEYRCAVKFLSHQIYALQKCNCIIKAHLNNLVML